MSKHLPDPAEDAAAFAAHQLELLELERAAEIEQIRREQGELSDDELEARGVAIRRLVATDAGAGYGGRALVDLERPDGELPPHRFSSGDTVVLRSEDGEWSAVVVRTQAGAVRVALDDDEADPPSGGGLRLERLVSDVTWRRLRDAVGKLAEGGDPDLRAVLYGATAPCGDPSGDPSGDPGSDPAVPADLLERLDDAQREAVRFALQPGRRLALIHGPPGTGKTTALVALVRAAVVRGERVLATAPSNVAVDNLAERLADHGVRIVRIGHPARFTEAAQAHSVDALLERSGDRKLMRDVRRELDDLRRRGARSGLPRSERRALRDDVRRVRGELRQLERAALRGVLDTAEVVLATTTGAADPRLLDRDADRLFDRVVVDEAGQALEAACWIPLLRGRSAVLAGDHLQLPPTIRSDAAARAGLERTMFERLIDRFGDDAARMLTTQYRMNAVIMDWASQAMYGGRLVADASVRDHLLSDDAGFAPDEYGLADCALVFVDTAGCGFEETAGGGGVDDMSRSNPGEADLVQAHVERLHTCGVPWTSIGVVTPYLAQVRLLRQRLATACAEGLEVHTVDGFQGREKDAIVLSLVRSNDRAEVGFLAEARRLNVAVTRARRHCAVFGDSATLGADPFLAGLVEACGANGQHRSAYELGIG